MVSLVALLAAPGVYAPIDAGSDAISPIYARDIVVTAERREEPEDEVPIAVSVLAADQLKRLPILDLQDLQHYVPELQTSQFSRDSTVIVIRGQGPGVGAYPGVLTYFNEVPFVGLGDGVYYDLANVQILKGPQGTLFGRNSNGGAILFTSAAPQPGFGGYAQAEFGTYNDRQIQGALNLPILRDDLTLRIAGTHGSRSGYTKVLSGGRLDDRDFDGGRASLRWRPDERIKNDLILDYTHVGTAGTSTILRGISPSGAIGLLPPQLTAIAFEQLAEQQALGPRTQVGISVDPVHQARQFGAQDHLDLTLSPTFALSNIIAYRHYKLLFRSDYDGTDLPLLDYSVTPDGYVVNDEQVTEELQLHGSWDQLRYTAGVYWQHNWPGAQERQTGVIYFSPVAEVNDANDFSRAVYGQFEYDLSAITPGLKLAAGGRYTWDRRSQTAGTTVLSDNLCSTIGGVPPDCLISGKVRFHAPSWSLTASWQPRPDLLVYLTSRHGYKSGGLNLGQPIAAAQVYRPEYLTDVEFGAKTQFVIGGLRLYMDADVYRGSYNDVQVNGLTAADGALFNIVENGASATVQGLELNSSLSLGRRLAFCAAYAYTDAHYDHYQSTIYGNLTNAPWPYTAKHRLSLAATLFLPVPSAIGQPALGVHYSLQSHSTFGYDPDPFNREPGYALIDLSLDLNKIAHSPVDVGLFVTNAANKLYRTGSIGLYNTLGLSSSVYAPPRMVGVKIRITEGSG